MQAAILESGNVGKAELGDALAGKVVVDVTNRVDPANPGSTMDGTSAAEQIQARAPEARVVKAFNTAFASRQADPWWKGSPWTPSSPATTTRPSRPWPSWPAPSASAPIDAGPLVMARALAAMALLNITLQLRHNWPGRPASSWSAPPRERGQATRPWLRRATRRSCGLEATERASSRVTTPSRYRAIRCWSKVCMP
jgi:hypothetical protein